MVASERESWVRTYRCSKCYDGSLEVLEQGQNGWKYSKDENLGKIQRNYYNFDYLITGDPKLHGIRSSSGKGVWSVAHVSNIFSGIDFRLTNGTLFKVSTKHLRLEEGCVKNF